jgi:ketosteroid isomerase-like protein
MRSWPYTRRSARFITNSGETLIGRDRIRKVVGSLIEAKARLYSRVVKAVTVGDIAQLYTDFEGTMHDESGKSFAIRNRAIEVLRRQPDGTWKLIVGDPNGRE